MEMAKSRSRRDGLQFPVGRIHRPQGKGNYTVRVGAEALVYPADSGHSDGVSGRRIMLTKDQRHRHEGNAKPTGTACAQR